MTAVAEAPDRCAAARELLAPFRDAYPFEPRFLALEGGANRPFAGARATDRVHLHHLDEGPRDAPPVLCLHGNPTWSFLFRHLARDLAGPHRVVAPDHVGCGLSDKPTRYPYRLETHVANVEELVLALDLRGITLVLHDWGGAIGMGFARRHPDRVRRIVVSNTAAFPSRRMPLRIAACRTPVLGPLAVRGLGAFSRAALRMAVGRGPLPEPARRAYLAPHGSWRTRAATLAFVRDIPMDERHPSWAELAATERSLAAFRDRPMLVLWGERDWCFTPRFREEWQARFPGARTRVFEDAGHWVWEDAGEEAVRAIAEFLAEPSR